MNWEALLKNKLVWAVAVGVIVALVLMFTGDPASTGSVPL